MPRKRVVLALIDEQYVRNYVSSGLVNDLEIDFEVAIICPEGLQNSLGASNHAVGMYLPHINNSKYHVRILNHLTWVNRNRSSSFKYRRARRNGLFLSGINQQKISIPKKIALYFRLIGWWLYRQHRHVYENHLVSSIYLTFLRKRIQINQSMHESILEFHPDIVCCPVSVFDFDALDILAITKQMGTRTLFIADNWDNVSSKTVYTDKPDHFAVFGEQSKHHAVSIQNFHPEDVSCIGSARFSQYFTDRHITANPDFGFKYILFTGTALFFDEEESLESLSKIIESNREIFGETKIVYRPHPHRQIPKYHKRRFLPNNIILDSQSKRRVGSDPIDQISQNDLSHYSKLLNNAELVVGGLTTMLLEASIFYKDFIALAHDDGINFTSQHRVLKSYTHLEGIEALPNVHLVHSKERLEEVLINVWRYRSLKDKGAIDRQRNYFLFDDEEVFSKRLSRLIQKVLED